MFKPYTRDVPLPEPGEQNETTTLDFKQELTKEPFERAKDVAAFANGVGGTILVGVAEDRKRGVVGKYMPLTPEEAAAAQKGYDDAIKARCSPKPLYSVERLDREGGIVLAVNVWPYPGQVVGVRTKADKDAKGYGGDAYVFPMRVGDGAIYLQPDQLAMLMLPEIRRTAFLLSRIPPQETVVVALNAPPAWNTAARPFVYVGCDVLENRLTLAASDEHGSYHLSRPVVVPLDAVRNVWKDGECWRIALRGYIGKEADERNKCFVPYG